MKTIRLLLATVALTMTSGVLAQAPPEAQRPTSGTSAMADQIAHLDKLDFMVGTWRGSGWMMLGPSHRAEFTQTETVTHKLNGAILTIDGDGRDAAAPERHIHDAFGVISYEPATGYHFMPFSGGNKLDVVATVAGKVFTWGFDAPYGKTRFTLDFSSGEWHETGELSRDGGNTWTKNFRMTLSRSS